MAEIAIKGIGVCEGIRIGKAYKYETSLNISYKDISRDKVDDEVFRFKACVEKSKSDMDELIEKTKAQLGEDKAIVLKGQKSFLIDPTFCPEMEKLIVNSNYSAEKATSIIVDRFKAILEKMPNKYMQERAADVADIGKRILTELTGVKNMKLSEIKEEIILIAEDLAPSETAQLNKKYIKAFVTQKGGKTSHTAIFSKSLGIPSVVGIGEGFDIINNDDIIIVDGFAETCIVNPSNETLQEYTDKMRKEEEFIDSLNAYTSVGAVTKDNYEVEIAANIGSIQDVEYALEQGAKSVGLFRTELLYMSEKSLPSEEKQFDIYKQIIEKMNGEAVIFRTLDIGGDKDLPYFDIPKEMNPFLGYRAIRLCLDKKDIFDTQLRAILRASNYGKIKIMFPMISSLEELAKAKEIYENVKNELIAEGIEFDKNIEIGIMIEVPSAAIMADAFAKEVDFFSIGTNDLVQYTLAVDRTNEKVANLYDHFNPAIIRLIKIVVDAAHENGKSVGMCGGMAGDELAVPLLLALGLDELSMSANSIKRIKQIVNSLYMDKCKDLLHNILAMNSAYNIKNALKTFQDNTSNLM